MNNYPHSIRIHAPATQELRTAVAAAIDQRFQSGPFETVHSRRAGWRHVYLARTANDHLQVWENGGGLTPGPSLLLLALRSALPHASLEETAELHPGTPPTWRATVRRLHYRLVPDLQESRFSAFLQSLPAALATAFPLKRPDGAAFVEWRSGRVQLPTEPYSPSLFTYKCYVRLELLLILAAGSKRRQALTILNFPVLTPGRTFIYRGEHFVWAVDEFAQELRNLSQAFIQELRERFEGVPSHALTTLSLSKLFSQDTALASDKGA